MKRYEIALFAIVITALAILTRIFNKMAGPLSEIQRQIHQERMIAPW